MVNNGESEIFLDVCPKAFEILLNFLRSGCRTIPPNTNVCTESIGSSAQMLGVDICQQSKKGPDYCKIVWTDERSKNNPLSGLCVVKCWLYFLGEKSLGSVIVKCWVWRITKLSPRQTSGCWMTDDTRLSITLSSPQCQRKLKSISVILLLSSHISDHHSYLFGFCYHITDLLFTSDERWPMVTAAI